MKGLDHLTRALSLLIVICCNVSWGKLEDYEFQDVDPPVQEEPKLSLTEALLKNLEKKGFGKGGSGAGFGAKGGFGAKAGADLFGAKGGFGAKAGADLFGAKGGFSAKMGADLFGAKGGFGAKAGADLFGAKAGAKGGAGLFDGLDGSEDNAYDSGRPPRVNKHLYKSETLMTNRITMYPSDPPMALCRCWESKKFPFCDGAHRAHNERNKDNIGPIIVCATNYNIYLNRTENEKDSEESTQRVDSKEEERKK